MENQQAIGVKNEESQEKQKIIYILLILLIFINYLLFNTRYLNKYKKINKDQNI